MSKLVSFDEVPYNGFNPGDKVIVMTKSASNPSVYAAYFRGVRKTARGGDKVVVDRIVEKRVIWDARTDAPYDWSSEKTTVVKYNGKNWKEHNDSRTAARQGCYSKVVGTEQFRSFLVRNKIFSIDHFANLIALHEVPNE